MIDPQSVNPLALPFVPLSQRSQLLDCQPTDLYKEETFAKNKEGQV